LDKAVLFNTHFNSVNVDDDGNLPEFPRRDKSNSMLDTVQFTAEKIYKVIRKLKPEMTCNPDGYSTFLVQQLASAFADPLALLFSSFLSIGKIPSAWKRAIITRVSSNSANYRPFELQPTWLSIQTVHQCYFSYNFSVTVLVKVINF